MNADEAAFFISLKSASRARGHSRTRADFFSGFVREVLI